MSGSDPTNRPTINTNFSLKLEVLHGVSKNSLCISFRLTWAVEIKQAKSALSIASIVPNYYIYFSL